MSIWKCSNDILLNTTDIKAFYLFFRFEVDSPNFFDSGTRNLIINFILERQHFVEGEETPDNLGIEKLLADGVYDSAYTLHDVSYIFA